MEETMYGNDMYGESARVEEEDVYDYDDVFEALGESSGNVQITARDMKNIRRFSSTRFCREMVLSDMSAYLTWSKEYHFKVVYDGALRHAALAVRGRYDLKDVRIGESTVTFTSKPQDAFCFIWWAVGLARGEYTPGMDEDELVMRAVRGLESYDRKHFALVARLWFDVEQERALDLRNPNVSGIISAFQKTHPPRLMLRCGEPRMHERYYRMPQEFAYFQTDPLRVAYVSDASNATDYDALVETMRKAMPAYRFWRSEKYGGVAVAPRKKERANLRSPIFWLFVLINGNGVIEDGFGFPLTEQQKERARASFGKRVNTANNHTFIVGRRTS